MNQFSDVIAVYVEHLRQGVFTTRQ